MDAQILSHFFEAVSALLNGLLHGPRIGSVRKQPLKRRSSDVSLSLRYFPSYLPAPSLIW